MNKPVQAVVILALLSWSGTVAAQAAGLELRLESDVTTKLPGLPVPVRLVAVNQTSRALPLPLTVFFHATDGTAERFLGGFDTGWVKTLSDTEKEDPALDARLPLAPRATVVANLGVSPNCDRPPFLLDPFLARPGRYTVRAVAAADVSRLADAAQESTLAQVLQALPEAVVSAPWTLDVQTPQGADAGAWTYLTDASAGRGWLGLASAPAGQAFYARELRQQFPDSQYTLCFGATWFSAANAAEMADLAERARTATPRPPMLDWLDVQIAGYHGALCNRNLLEPRNVPAAISECEAARALYDRLRTTAQNLDVRARSETGFQTTMPAEEIHDFVLNLEARESGNFRKVVPVLQCVKESGARLEARFGYENPNPFTVNIARGAMNFFTPGPEDRGQPTRFPPGTAENVVSVTIDAKRNDPGRTISWTLDGMTATAPASSAPRCKGK